MLYRIININKINLQISTDFELQLPALNTLTSSNTTISTITLTNNKNTRSTNLTIQFGTVYTLQLNESINNNTNSNNNNKLNNKLALILVQMDVNIYIVYDVIYFFISLHI